jgi:hypothetical protein
MISSELNLNRFITVPHVLQQRKYWASEIERLVVRHSRVKKKEKKEKNKGMF